MTQWLITQTPAFPHRYAIKQYSGIITNKAGEKKYYPKGTVMIDDATPPNKAAFTFEIDGTIFLPAEWNFFVKCGYSEALYNLKRFFDCDIILDREKHRN